MMLLSAMVSSPSKVMWRRRCKLPAQTPIDLGCWVPTKTFSTRTMDSQGGGVSYSLTPSGHALEEQEGTPDPKFSNLGSDPSILGVDFSAWNKQKKISDNFASLLLSSIERQIVPVVQSLT
jgi:hypothetical protein